MLYRYKKLKPSSYRGMIWIKNFLTDRESSAILEKNNLDELYKKAVSEAKLFSSDVDYERFISLLTEFFYNMDIDIFDYINYVPNYCFYNSYLLEITLPDKIENIGIYSFYRTNIKEITIPGNVSVIEIGAFVDCRNLKEIYINEGVQKIEQNCFCDINDDAVIHLPYSINSLPKNIINNYQKDRITFIVPRDSYAQDWCDILKYRYETV